MSLDIRQREREGIAILDLSGRLVVGPEATQLRENIRTMQAQESRQVLLNLEGVDYIDSTGLGTLVICFTSLQKMGGALKLCCLTRRNIELLVLTKLETVFEIFATESDAVNSFFPNREIKHFDILQFVREQQKSE